MEKSDINYQEYVAGLVARAKKAQAIAEGHDQNGFLTALRAGAVGRLQRGFPQESRPIAD